MKILAIESSALTASAAVTEDGLLRSQYTINNKLTHSVTLLPMIKSMCELSGISVSEADAIALSAGPGSFTGLRIGAATAKGLALALNKPVIRVSTLDSMGIPLSRVSDSLICPCMDARRGQVYCASYYRGKLVSERDACDIRRFLDRIISDAAREAAGARSFVFTGDGADAHRDIIGAALGERAAFAEAPYSRQSAACTALLGEELYRDWLDRNSVTAEYVRELGADAVSFWDDTVMLSDDLVPDYIRKSQAEQAAEAGTLEDAGQHSLKKMR